MEPIFTDKQLNNMSREDLISLMKIVQEQTKKKDTEIQLLKDKQKELEFLNAMLSDRLCKFCSNGTPILELAVHSFWFSGTRFLLKTVRFSFIIVM